MNVIARECCNVFVGIFKNEFFFSKRLLEWMKLDELKGSWFIVKFNDLDFEISDNAQ